MNNLPRTRGNVRIPQESHGSLKMTIEVHRNSGLGVNMEGVGLSCLTSVYGQFLLPSLPPCQVCLLRLYVSTFLTQAWAGVSIWLLIVIDFSSTQWLKKLHDLTCPSQHPEVSRSLII